MISVPVHLGSTGQTGHLCVILDLQPFQIGHCTGRDRGEGGSAREETRVVASDNTGIVNGSEDSAETKVVGTGLVGGSDWGADDKAVVGASRGTLGI